MASTRNPATLPSASDASEAVKRSAKLIVTARSSVPAKAATWPSSGGRLGAGAGTGSFAAVLPAVRVAAGACSTGAATGAIVSSSPDRALELAGAGAPGPAKPGAAAAFPASSVCPSVGTVGRGGAWLLGVPLSTTPAGGCAKPSPWLAALLGPGASPDGGAPSSPDATCRLPSTDGIAAAAGRIAPSGSETATWSPACTKATKLTYRVCAPSAVTTNRSPPCATTVAVAKSTLPKSTTVPGSTTTTCGAPSASAATTGLPSPPTGTPWPVSGVAAAVSMLSFSAMIVGSNLPTLRKVS